MRERNPNLVLAGDYERSVAAPLEAVWENVFDWEHLPWLHAQAFASIALRAEGDWGWHADVGFPGGAEAEIELVADREQRRYVARTCSGAGAPGEIWTRLDPVTSDHTQVRVEFWVLPTNEEALGQIGSAYAALYAGLWDQDEGMIRTRRDAFAARDHARVFNDPTTGTRTRPAARLELGRWSDLAPQLPRIVEFGGHRFRLVEREGGAVAYSTECPHWLGPLDEGVLEGDTVTCPWHGYRFDISSGVCTSAKGAALRLRRAPRVEIDRATGLVSLVSPASSTSSDVGGSDAGGPADPV